MNFVIEER